MHRFPRAGRRTTARSVRLHAIPGGATAPAAAGLPPTPSVHTEARTGTSAGAGAGAGTSAGAGAAIGAPLLRCLVVRTDSPGLLLVHLHAAGLHVAAHGNPGQGQLRVHTDRVVVIRSIAALCGAAVLDLHELWLARVPVTAHRPDRTPA